MDSFVDSFKRFMNRLAQSRILTVSVVFMIMSGILLQRVFVLQIVNGENYMANYTLKIEKEREIAAARGNIYDRNGELLAYNELAYSVAIEDNGTYDSARQRSEELNSAIAKTIQIIESRGDVCDNDFNILYENGEFDYAVSGTARLRFLADVFGKATVDELGINNKLGFNEATASARQVMEYLMYNKYEISKDYGDKMAYQIAIVRYGLSTNYYRKFITTTIATDVSDETVAAINENASELQGVSIEESKLRKYEDSEYFCHIVGYTGKISQDELTELQKEDKSYSLNDYIGKAGIEQVMESQLKGTKGSEKFYVDNLGKIVKIVSSKDSVPGNDVYLSIDKDLQENVYNLLEQQIAGIVYSSIANIKSYNAGANSTSSDVKIPIYDVYFALIDNNIIDIDEFADEDALENEAAVYKKFQSSYASTKKRIEGLLTTNNTHYKDLARKDSEYVDYIISMLKTSGIIDTNAIDKEDETFVKWADGKLSVKDYLKYAVSKNWISITSLTDEESSKKDTYSDSAEIYQALVSKITGMLDGEKEFHKLVYKYMINDDIISGNQICLLLYEQDVLAQDDTAVAKLKSGSIGAYAFLKSKIKNLEIKPSQLALDPCSGSCVVTDPETGEILASVSYPGYDNNKLANAVDSDYYASLLEDNATPLYDFATQQETAPGSTFKPLMSVAGMAEGVIGPYETIYDEGVFKKIDNEPKCWLYRSSHGSHGSISVSGALRDSCNYFFYEVGYRLSTVTGTYSDERGIRTIQKYADLFGLSEKTGVEIPESEPNMATEYPVVAAIGQSNNNYTTIGLARYVTAVANSGTVYNFTLLDSVRSSDGTVLEDYKPKVRNKIDILNATEWDVIHYGMRLVCANSSAFDSVKVPVAGKTGTAQQVKTRPSHALFIGYAPYDKPTIALATRIPFGYSSSNAAEVSAAIIKYCFGESSGATGTANDVSGGRTLD